MAFTMRLDYKKHTITLGKKFSKLSSIPGTPEYEELAKVKADFPYYKIIVREIKRNDKKECYKGLTYDYMREYIKHNESSKTRASVLDELEENIIRSRCHSKGFRYPVIKSWFLQKYPEVKCFGNSQELKATLDEENNIRKEVKSNVI